MASLDELTTSTSSPPQRERVLGANSPVAYVIPKSIITTFLEESSRWSCSADGTNNPPCYVWFVVLDCLDVIRAVKGNYIAKSLIAYFEEEMVRLPIEIVRTTPKATLTRMTKRTRLGWVAEQ